MTLGPVHMGEWFNVPHAHAVAVVFLKRFCILVWMGEDNVKMVVHVDMKLLLRFSEMHENTGFQKCISVDVALV